MKGILCHPKNSPFLNNCILCNPGVYEEIFTLTATLTLLLPVFPQHLKKMEIVGKPRKKTDGELITRKDANGCYCAAIKFVSDMDGFSYDSWDGIVGDIKDQPQQDIVFVTPTERKLEVFKTGYEPLKVILADQGNTNSQARVFLNGEEQSEKCKTYPSTFKN
mgnify:CR=1 FL=1